MDVPYVALAVFWQPPAEPKMPGVSMWTRMLRQPDEFSYPGMIIGIAHYLPDPEKAAR